MHSKYGVRLFNGESGHDSGSGSMSTASSATYDAFIHYSLKDNAFVQQRLASGLENSSYRLLLHHRDVVVRTSTQEAIEASMASSATVIVIATASYVRSDIALAELAFIKGKMKTGSLARKSGGGGRVLVIAVDDEGARHAKKRLGDLNVVVLKWKDSPSFWQKLRQNLPSPTTRHSSQNSSSFKTTTIASSPTSFSSSSSSAGAVDKMRSSPASNPAAVSAGITGEYEDDLWTYVKGVGVAQPAHSGSSGGVLIDGGNGHDSSISTRSTTDTSTTLPYNSSSKLSMPSRSVIVNPLVHGGTHSMLPPARSSQHHQRKSRTHHRQQKATADLDHEYVSVNDSLGRVNPRLPEPIYHTLEPPAYQQESRRNSRRKRPQNGDSTDVNGVYINSELQVIYPQTSTAKSNKNGGYHQTRYLNMLSNESEDFVDEDDGLLAVDDEHLYDDERLFAAAGSPYVPPPAPSQQQASQRSSSRRRSSNDSSSQNGYFI